ncbi:hypothetical protein OIU76_007030 [Salix suchowensis]|nr:hypothetical protein OIU76_007030 [Salix suchowensis]
MENRVSYNFFGKAMKAMGDTIRFEIDNIVQGEDGSDAATASLHLEWAKSRDTFHQILHSLSIRGLWRKNS